MNDFDSAAVKSRGTTDGPTEDHWRAAARALGERHWRGDGA